MTETAETTPVAPRHHHWGHRPGVWHYACCACSGLFDPGCAACVYEEGK